MVRIVAIRSLAATVLLLALSPANAWAQSGPFIDLNGDGSGDVFTYNPATGDWARQVTLSQGGFSTIEGSWSPGWTVTPADFNTDALTDFFLFNTSSGQWSKMLNDGAGFTTQGAGTWWPDWERHGMNLDGDGVTDFFLYDPATGAWFKCLSTLGGFTYMQGGWSPGWEVHSMTLNADEFGDLFLFNRTTGRWFWVLGEFGEGFTYPVSEIWFPGWQIHPGDFSGDGLTDILLHDPATGTYFVAINNGAEFSYVQGVWSLGWTPHVADLDADSREDLLLHDQATGIWFEMISDGTGGFANAGGEAWSLGWQIFPTDFNADGRADFVLYDPATGAWYQAWNFTSGSFTYVSGQWQSRLSIGTALDVTLSPPPPVTCLVTTADLTIGNTTLALNGCDAAVGGDLHGTNLAATIVGTPTPQVNVTGTCVGTCDAMGKLVLGSAPPVDPLAGLAEPANPGGCVFGTAATLTPGCYTSIADTVTTLLPGIYYVTGTVDIGKLTGSDVMIYLVGGGNLVASNNKSLTLSAPTTGPYRGIALFEAPSNTNNFNTGNNFSLSVSGAIYAPGADLDFPNALTLADTGCTFFLARSISFRNATGTLSHDNCAALYGDALEAEPNEAHVLNATAPATRHARRFRRDDDANRAASDDRHHTKRQSSSRIQVPAGWWWQGERGGLAADPPVANSAGLEIGGDQPGARRQAPSHREGRSGTLAVSLPPESRPGAGDQEVQATDQVR